MFSTMPLTTDAKAERIEAKVFYIAFSVRAFTSTELCNACP